MVVDLITHGLSHLSCEVGLVVVVSVRAPVIDISVADTGISETFGAGHETIGRLVLRPCEPGLMVIAGNSIVLLKWSKARVLCKLVDMLGGGVVNSTCTMLRRCHEAIV